MRLAAYNAMNYEKGSIKQMVQNQQERLLAEAQAIVRTYRPINALIPAHWQEEDVFANGIRDNEGYRAWFKTWLSRLEQVRTMNHEERMLSTLPQLFFMTGGVLWPEEEYVPMVESNALFDLDLARERMKLWSSEYRGNSAETLKQLTCPVLVMKQTAAFPMSGAQPIAREESSAQPNARLVTFENTGHLIGRMAFEQYMNLVQEFLAAP